MNSSDTSTQDSGDQNPGYWKVEIRYSYRNGSSNTIESIFYANSLSDLYSVLGNFTAGQIYSNGYNIKEKLPDSYVPITYTFIPENEWDEEKDTRDMTPDRILDFELIKIKKITYYMPACDAGPEAYGWDYDRTVFDKTGAYDYEVLDYSYGQYFWREIKRPFIQKIDLSSIVRSSFDELNVLYKEYSSLSKARIDEQNRFGSNNIIIDTVDKKLQELSTKLNQMYSIAHRTFGQRLDYATGNSGQYFGGSPGEFPCAKDPGHIDPSWVDYYLYGRILWNSTKDLGEKEQRLRYQTFHRWPEDTIEDIRNGSGNIS